ncbi:hypothetical protein HOA55_00685 [archaeon]|jgi:hypothetical protein|nr:hypothetical protein [archaeon]MBT3578228.1 hypothetical protein [archaeon]MBT6819851.1 hypothetical protein [archaeon]MBT6955738.1 hypothetical protein [archaeon]MBT7025633.1 hypothetical protein [archaeon]
MDNELTENLKGPFWPGQGKHSCGHYFPNVLKVRVREGTATYDCKICGEFDQPTSLGYCHTKADDLAPEDLDRIRKDHFERLKKAPRSLLNQTS